MRHRVATDKQVGRKAMENGKVALITGAARRLGAQMARTLHDAGWRVAIHYRQSAEEALLLLDEFNARRAHSACCLSADLLDTARLPELVDTTLAKFGRLDTLINNASSFYPTPIGTITQRDWDDLTGSNFRAPLFLSQAAAPALRDTGGCIVNIADIHADRPLPGYALYSASKGALATLTRALAIDLAPRVRVNGVAPGPIQWPENDLFDPEERARIVRHTLLQREGDPQDIARTVRFLIEDAPYITGQIIAVDGGRSVHL
jgi:pteridine reductase